MKYLVLIYGDRQLLDVMPEDEADTMLSECLAYRDELRRSGHLLDAQALQGPETATSLRVRNGRLLAADGPFAETREQLGGFGIIRARDLNEAIRVASRFPWARTGGIEVRPLSPPFPIDRNRT